MAEQQLEPLGAKEYDIIEKALWELVQQCPDIDPDLNMQYDALDSDKSLAVFTLPGGRVKKRNVLGGFVAELAFRVAYKSNPTQSAQRLNAQAFVGMVMKWLEETKDLPRLTSGRTITKINILTVPPFQMDVDEDKSTIYAADAVMEYEAE